MEKTLSRLCKYLKNYFNRGQYMYNGTIVIQDGDIQNTKFSDYIMDGQYYAIFGSVFNDGVHKYEASLSSQGLIDETVYGGTLELMAIPQEVIELAGNIEAWITQYCGADSANMSPFSSESFGGYSYSKGAGSASSGGSTSVSWQDAFAADLRPWRKI